MLSRARLLPSIGGDTKQPLPQQVTAELASMFEQQEDAVLAAVENKELTKELLADMPNDSKYRILGTRLKVALAPELTALMQQLETEGLADAGFDGGKEELISQGSAAMQADVADIKANILKDAIA